MRIDCLRPRQIAQLWFDSADKPKQERIDMIKAECDKYDKPEKALAWVRYYVFGLEGR